MEDETLAGNAQATAPENETATAQEGNESAPSEAQEQVSETRSHTQEEVNEIVRSRLDKAYKAIYDLCGVKDKESLNQFIEEAKAMKAEHDALKTELQGLREQNALRGNSVLPEREDDVRTYFKGKGLELSDEALKQALQSHPEWIAKATPTPATTTVVPLGSQAEEAPKPNEEEEAAKMFGLSRFVK